MTALITSRETRMQTPDGRMATISVTDAKAATNENGEVAMRSIRTALSVFYYPLLESCTYMLADLNTSLNQAGMFRQTNKFYYKRADKALSRVMDHVGGLFNSREYFREFSDAMWADAEPNLKRLDYAAWIAVGRIRKGKDVRVLSRLLIINQIAAYSAEVFHQVFVATKIKTGLGLEDFYSTLKPTAFQDILSMWLGTFDDVYDAVEEIRTNMASVTGFEAFKAMFDNEGNIEKWYKAAYSNIPEALRYAWKPAREKPHGNRRIVVMERDRTERYLYRYGKLWDSHGHGRIWNTEENMGWRYESAKNATYEDIIARSEE